MSRGSGLEEGRIPVGAGAEHDVEDGEEFADAGDDGDLVELAGGDEAVVEGAHGRIEADGGAGGHPEAGADGGAATGAAALATRGATSAIERSDTDEGGDGLAVQASQLGQVQDQQRGG